MRLMPGHRRFWQAGLLPAELPKLLTIGALSTTLVLALAARTLLPTNAFLAVVTTALFGLALVATGVAYVVRRRSGQRLGWLDLAGIFTCIGIVASMMIEPEEAVQFVTGIPRSE
jgi:hypothetical protein